MLTELRITNFALIDDLTLEPSGGFSVLTGETGAGKSIIVDALGVVLGDRADPGLTRTGADRCLIQAVFDLSNNAGACECARDLGCDPEECLLILTRELNRNGKSSLRINGRTVTASVVRAVTSHLIDIYGQHEHQSLLNVSSHIDIFDTWLGAQAGALREDIADLWRHVTAIEAQLRSLHDDERERVRNLDLWRFQVNEIREARLSDEEETQLDIERNRLANAQKLAAAAASVYELLSSEGGIVDLLGEAESGADKMAAVDSGASDIAETITGALVSAQESLALVRRYSEGIEESPERLEQVSERIDLIKTLKRKYGDSIPEVLAYAEEMQCRIAELEHAEERGDQMETEIEALRTQLTDASSRLNAIRRKGAPAFEKAVQNELQELAMGKTRFEVACAEVAPGPKGSQTVEFMISPNPGEPVKPLAKIASGGEMSRVMLALKTVTAPATASRTGAPTLVFDEIDAGIGGRTAAALGEKLAALASGYQVLCVTHLPQVAGKADRHFSVTKATAGGRTAVHLEVVDGDQRVGELARMLGADERSDAAAVVAREMLVVADKGNR